MTSRPRLLLAVDHGTATASAALLGEVEGRWRLLGSAAGPADLPLEPVIGELAETVRAADPALAAALLLPDGAGLDDPERLPRLVARTAPAPRLAVLAASHRQAEALEIAAEASGWRTAAHALVSGDRLGIVRLLLDPSIDAVLVGASDPPAADERSLLAELAWLVAGLADRRPELRIVLAGGAAARAGAFGDRRAEEPDPATEPDPEPSQRRAPRVVAIPAADPADPTVLRAALRDLRPVPDDARSAIARTTASLAAVLDRRIETIEIGFDGGLRCVAEPTGDGRGSARSAHVAAAALVPPEPDDALLRAVMEWSPLPLDRHRLRDRLLDLRREPWGEPAGEGALLRLSAARAAVERLLLATPDLEGSPPDLVLAAGGAWAAAPGPAVALALADVVRRSGVSQYAVDGARLLAPLGMIVDEAERRSLLADLADDLLVPLGSVAIMAGLHRSGHPGEVTIESGVGRIELELAAGGLQLVDLPPGELATASFTFRDPVVLAGRGRAFRVEVSGGLGGFLVDLRDVPLHLPERSDRRRALLASWQAALWPELWS